jgi:class 3 adenylate cyclase
MDERMDDIRAVMDAAGSDRATLLGVSEGGPMSIMFAASAPERVTGLVLFGSFPRFSWAPDYPWGVTDEDQAKFLHVIDKYWGEGRVIGYFNPGMLEDPEDKARMARFERLAASPGSVADLVRANALTDVRPAMSAVHVPTTVIHRVNDPVIDPGAGRLIADSIAGARFVELAGRSHSPWVGDVDALVDEIEEFVTGSRGVAAADRVLATVLFTDIVESTASAVDAGDAAWRRTLDDHDRMVRRQLERHRGREVNTTGDGFIATFDGPARAIRCAQAIASGAAGLGLAVRAGVHTGEVEVRGADVGGVAVHIGARVAALAGGGEVLVSSTVRDLTAGSGITFEDKGDHELKGVPGTFRLLAAH